MAAQSCLSCLERAISSATGPLTDIPSNQLNKFKYAYSCIAALSALLQAKGEELCQSKHRPQKRLQDPTDWQPQWQAAIWMLRRLHNASSSGSYRRLQCVPSVQLD